MKKIPLLALAAMAALLAPMTHHQAPRHTEPTPDDLARIEKALAKREKKALRRARILLSAKP
jgi:hypothetical protein